MSVSATNQSSEPGQELFRLERFREIVIGPGIDALHLLRPAPARRQDQDGHGPPGRSPPLEHRDPVHARQTEIENDRIVGLGVAQKVSLLAVARAVDGVACAR